MVQKKVKPQKKAKRKIQRTATNKIANAKSLEKTSKTKTKRDRNFLADTIPLTKATTSIRTEISQKTIQLRMIPLFKI